MTYFEERGVERQHRARTKTWAIRMFEHSCMDCCVSGRYINCEHCAIAGAHENVLQRLEVM